MKLAARLSTKMDSFFRDVSPILIQEAHFPETCFVGLSGQDE